MKRCGFLTMENREGFECYDSLLIEPMAARGWQVEQVPWKNNDINWGEFDAVIVRSPWDYQDDSGLFMEVIETIDQSSARLENSRRLIRWNLDKTYLAEMEQKGIRIVPTFWGEHWKRIMPDKLFERWKTDEMIIKPRVSANADDTFRLKKESVNFRHGNLQSTFGDRPFMIQPFKKKIITEGEFSLFYFAGRFSHAILKTPKPGDFRVQEEYGGRLTSINPGEPLKSLAQKVIQNLPEEPLYARVDFVRTGEGSDQFQLMEIELIEPSLYFNMDPKSPARFTRAFDQWMQQKTNHSDK